MSKQIRPLSAYKKANPNLFHLLDSLAGKEINSKKGRENAWYFTYGLYETETGVEDYEARYEDSFFLVGRERTNISTVSELGRLLLTGWYYNIEDWAKEISFYVYNSYHKKLDRGDAFNDLEFKEAIKHIRDNIGYYYHNKDELKLYILETFFKSDLEPLLPEPPPKLKKHNRVTELVETIHKNRLKQDKNWYVKNFELLEQYGYYLSEILDSYDIPYLSLEDFKAQEDKKTEEYYNEIREVENSYRASLKDIPLPKLPSPKK